MKEKNEAARKVGLNYPLTILSVGLLLVVVLFLALRPDETVATIQGVFDLVLESTGPFLLLFDAFLIVLSFFFAFSRYGRIKLGDGAPEYSLFSYIAMMACAALASASMFWSFTEWANYVITPGLGITPFSTDAIEMSVGYTFFHWGFLAQCIYVIIGLITAYALYIRKTKTLRMSDIVSDMLGDFRGKKIIVWLVDIIVIFCTLAGLGVSLGLGVPVIAGGIHAVTGIEVSFAMQVGIVMVLGIVFSWSSFVGTGRGMKFLSDNTVKLLFLFLAFVVVTGPTSMIFKTFVSGLGKMLQHTPEMTFFSDPIQQTGFAEAWTIFFIAFPLSYAGLMGVFVAKISKGRTIRSLVLCCMLGISIGTWIFFAINSGLAIDCEIRGIYSMVTEVQFGDPYAGVFSLLNTLPLGKVLAVIYTLCVTGFICTTLDTASLALASTTTTALDENNNPSKKLRLFWCLMLVLLPLALMFSGSDFDAMKNLAILIAIPIAVVIIYMVFGLLRWMQQDRRIPGRLILVPDDFLLYPQEEAMTPPPAEPQKEEEAAALAEAPLPEPS